VKKIFATTLALALLLIFSSVSANAAPGRNPQLNIQCPAPDEFYPDAVLPEYSWLKPNAMYKYYGKKATIYKYLDGISAGRVISSRDRNSNEWVFFDASVIVPPELNRMAYTLKYKIVDSYKRSYTWVCS